MTNLSELNNVDSIHPSYTDALEQWQTVEDLCDGSLKVKQAGDRYLPHLSEQSDKDYDNYRKRATFVNMTERTRESLTGMLMRKKPQIDAKPIDDRLMADMTLGGHTIVDWARAVCSQAVSTGRSATVVDWNEALKRPYFSHYKAPDVLNWASARKDGVEILILLVVRERDEEVEDFAVRQVIKIRRYRLTDAGVECEVWKQNVETADKKNVAWEQVGQSTIMKRNGKPLMAIPAVFHNAMHIGCEIGKVPLYDIAEINVSHYQTSADLENGRHICGLPTPYACGVDSDGDLVLGSSKAWTAENSDAKFGFVEFTGQGLAPLENALKEKQEQMAILGARLMFNQSREAEAFETVQLRANSESAALTNISGHASATTTKALQWFAWWLTPSAENPFDIVCSMTINSDFAAMAMAPQTLTALISALNTNAISMETFFFQLQKGEIYPDDWDLERETSAIAQRPMIAPPIKQPAPPAPPEAK